MNKRGICSECDGQGFYIIHNAYNPDAKQEVICEYCEGKGAYNEARSKRRKKAKEWVN